MKKMARAMIDPKKINRKAATPNFQLESMRIKKVDGGFIVKCELRDRKIRKMNPDYEGPTYDSKVKIFLKADDVSAFVKKKIGGMVEARDIY